MPSVQNIYRAPLLFSALTPVELGTDIEAKIAEYAYAILADPKASFVLDISGQNLSEWVQDIKTGRQLFAKNRKILELLEKNEKAIYLTRFYLYNAENSMDPLLFA